MKTSYTSIAGTGEEVLTIIGGDVMKIVKWLKEQVQSFEGFLIRTENFLYEIDERTMLISFLFGFVVGFYAGKL